MSVSVLKEYLSYDSNNGQMKWIKHSGPMGSIGSIAGKKNNDRYARVQLKGKNMLAHRVAWALHYGTWPSDQIDHINGDMFDNRISNLRCVTAYQNMRNLSVHRLGKLWGASFTRGKWHAQFRYKNVSYFIGVFDTDKEAHAACLGFIKAKKWDKKLDLI